MPTLNMPFLTDLDENARIKGSRDPLGAVSVWSFFGRKIVGNLTTASASVRGFTTLLLGLYVAEENSRGVASGTRVVGDRDAGSRGVGERSAGVPGGPPQSELATFLQFEQLAAYCRLRHNKDGDFRGKRRVEAKLAEVTRRVTLSASQEHQILSNQKQYGLWGLYSTPAQLSGLLEPGGRRLSAISRAFIEKNYLPRLPSRRGVAGGELFEQLKKSSVNLSLDDDLCIAVADIHKRRLTSAEKKFYSESLAFGVDQQTSGRQRRIASAVAEVSSKGVFDFDSFREMKKRLRNDPELTGILEQIEVLELTLVPMLSAFAFLLTRNQATVESVAEEIRRSWGPSVAVDAELLSTLSEDLARATDDQELAENWIRLGHALSAGDYVLFVEQLIRHNERVMQRRNNSAAWLAIENGRLRVRTTDEAGPLLERDKLASTWWSTFFLNSLAGIVHDVELGR